MTEVLPLQTIDNPKIWNPMEAMRSLANKTRGTLVMLSAVSIVGLSAAPAAAEDGTNQEFTRLVEDYRRCLKKNKNIPWYNPNKAPCATDCMIATGFDADKCTMVKAAAHSADAVKKELPWLAEFTSLAIKIYEEGTYLTVDKKEIPPFIFMVILALYLVPSTRKNIYAATAVGGIVFARFTAEWLGMQSREINDAWLIATGLSGIGVVGLIAVKKEWWSDLITEWETGGTKDAGYYFLNHVTREEAEEEAAAVEKEPATPPESTRAATTQITTEQPVSRTEPEKTLCGTCNEMEMGPKFCFGCSAEKPAEDPDQPVQQAPPRATTQPTPKNTTRANYSTPPEDQGIFGGEPWE